jgi:hypothetical protein
MERPNFRDIKVNNIKVLKKFSIDSVDIPVLNVDQLNVSSNINVNGSIQITTPNAFKTGSQFWNVLSDSSTKENIKKIDNDKKDKLLNLIENIDIKEFNYIGTDNQIIGVIANEVETLYSPSIKHFNNLKHVDFNDLFFGLILHSKKLSEQVKNLQSQIDELKNK